MVYWNLHINVVDIIINLILVALTTGITYYLFTYRPAEKRKKALKARLYNLKKEINESIITPFEKLQDTYEFYHKETVDSSSEDDQILIWSLIDIKDWNNFISNFQLLCLLDIQSKNYWKTNELALLMNSLAIDDKNYINLSIELTKLNAEIRKIDSIYGEESKEIWSIEEKEDLIPNDSENETLALVVSNFENIHKISLSIINLIDEIVR